MTLRERDTLFREALSNIQQRCGQALRDSSAKLAEETRAFAIEAESNNYMNPEIGFLRCHIERWKLLAVHLPIEIDSGMVSILKPLDPLQRSEVQDILVGYYDRLRDEYLRSWRARQAAKGKENEKPTEQFLKRIDTNLYAARQEATDRLEQAIATRRLVYSISRRKNLFNLVLGFVLGIVASYLATVLWNIITSPKQ